MMKVVAVAGSTCRNLPKFPAILFVLIGLINFDLEYLMSEENFWRL